MNVFKCQFVIPRFNLCWCCYCFLAFGVKMTTSSIELLGRCVILCNHTSQSNLFIRWDQANSKFSIWTLITQVITGIKLRMKLLSIISLCAVCHVIYASMCSGTSHDFCKVREWGPWTNCSSNCGGGIKRRAKVVCCDPVYSFYSCLVNCSINVNWYNNNAKQTELCGTCQNAGYFHQKQLRCTCKNGYGGLCCNGENVNIL